MKRIVLAALGAVFLCLPAQAGMGSTREPGVIVIGDDPGGTVDTYLMWVDRIRHARIPVRVEGLCHSACTLILSLPQEQVCVTHTASFGFHLATRGMLLLPDFTQALMRRYYPVRVQRWIELRGPLTAEFIYLAGPELSLMGVYPMCEQESLSPSGKE